MCSKLFACVYIVHDASVWLCNCGSPSVLLLSSASENIHLNGKSRTISGEDTYIFFGLLTYEFHCCCITHNLFDTTEQQMQIN